MFYAYFDESSDGKEEKIYVVAGFLGRFEQWSKIEWRWRERLDKYHIKYYHAVEAEFARKQFEKPPYRTDHKANLNQEQFRLLEDARADFLSVLTSGFVTGLSIGIPMAAFNAVANTPETQEKFGNSPYYYCSHLAMRRALHGIRFELGSKELIKFTFDRHEQHGPEMVRVHEEFRARDFYRSQIGTLDFGDKADCIPLQVADTLAYETRKFFESRMGDPNAPERAELKKLKHDRKVFTIDLCEEPCLQDHLQSDLSQAAGSSSGKP
jgi:uncharacterized protein DUF3800